MTTILNETRVRETGSGLVQCGAIAVVIGLLTAAASAQILTPLYGTTAGGVNNLSVAELQPNWVVTAAQTSADALQLTTVTAWEIHARNVRKLDYVKAKKKSA